MLPIKTTQGALWLTYKKAEDEHEFATVQVNHNRKVFCWMRTARKTSGETCTIPLFQCSEHLLDAASYHLTTHCKKADIKETYSDSAIYSTQPRRWKPDVGGKIVRYIAEGQVYPSLHNWPIVEHLYLYSVESYLHQEWEQDQQN